MTPDALAEHYLRSTGLHAVIAIGTANREAFRVLASAGVRVSTPTGYAVVSAWWCADAALAQRIAEFCYEIAAHNEVPRTGRWIRRSSETARALIIGSAQRLGASILADHDLRPRAMADCEAIEREMEEMRRRGELRSVNRSYAEERQVIAGHGRRAPTYGDYVMGLKLRLIGEAAARSNSTGGPLQNAMKTNRSN